MKPHAWDIIVRDRTDRLLTHAVAHAVTLSEALATAADELHFAGDAESISVIRRRGTAPMPT